MKCVQPALLSFCCEPDLGASPTFFTSHAALWGREATLADRSMGPRPLWASLDLWIIRGDPGDAASDQAGWVQGLTGR